MLGMIWTNRSHFEVKKDGLASNHSPSHQSQLGDVGWSLTRLTADETDAGGCVSPSSATLPMEIHLVITPPRRIALKADDPRQFPFQYLDRVGLTFFHGPGTTDLLASVNLSRIS